MRFFFLFFIFVFSHFFSFATYAYSDVDQNHTYIEAIEFLTEKGVVKGYDDDTFRPDDFINRAEFTKILVYTTIGDSPHEYAENCFDDIERSVWYAASVCYAYETNLLSGYSDGTFRPAKNINLAEAAKILVNVFDIPTNEPRGDQWYSSYVEAMADNRYIPDSFVYINQEVRRGEMAEMIWRVMERKQNQPSIAASDLKPFPCVELIDPIPNSIDMEAVRETWLNWYNDVRQQDGLHSYVYNSQLHRTANVWTEYARNRGYMDHKRLGQSAYYDYNMITQWFADLGLRFANVYRVTYSENISWGPYRCNTDDCTDYLIDAIRPTFDHYMGEKGESYAPHYNSVMNRYFNEIGFGISVDEVNRKFYLTVHYGTEIISDPEPMCE